MNSCLWNRREFVSAASACGLMGAAPVFGASEPPPETRRIRLRRYPVDVACVSPIWIAEELLRTEGFDEVQYLETTNAADLPRLAAGESDMGVSSLFGVLPYFDEGKPIVAIGGIHAGCFELFAAGGIRTIRELKGKTVVVANSSRRIFMFALLAHVGLDPRKDVTFLERPGPEGIQLFADGKADAFLGFSAEPHQLRAMKIGTSILSTTTDRPWSQYFCCTVNANRDFVARYPVATKRALRALLKATDICAAEPERTARTLVDRGFLKDYDKAATVLRDLPYKTWREFDVADTVRFYGLRLRDVGEIKSSPQKLLAQGTDLRFFEQLKKELKA